jgi:hypothetical protein
MARSSRRNNPAEVLPSFLRRGAEPCHRASGRGQAIRDFGEIGPPLAIAQVRFQVEIRLGALLRDLAVGGFDRALLGRPVFATLVIEEAPGHQFVDDAQRKLPSFPERAR